MTSSAPQQSASPTSRQIQMPPFEATVAWPEAIEALAAEVLLTTPAPAASDGSTPTFDAGLAILAALARDTAAGERGIARWLDDAERAAYSGALFGGLGGLLAGIALSQQRAPGLTKLTEPLIEAVSSTALAPGWMTEPRAWHDYDLISGPSGSVLALIAAGASLEHVAPLVDCLSKLLREPDLDGLRVTTYQHDGLRFWNYGRINTGLAHGVGGVALALAAAAETYPSLAERLIAPLQRVAAWMIGEAYSDASGLRTWAPAAREGRTPPTTLSRREAWCYGTPGLAWVLYEVGRTLGDAMITRFAIDAMASYCRVFDERRFIDAAPISDELAFCHGVAGILAIADAFARHADLPAAHELAQMLEAALVSRVDDIRRLGVENQTLLSGACGILAVLQTRVGGSRDWLRIVGLR